MMRRGWCYGKGAWLASLSGAALLSLATAGNADEARPKERRSCAASFNAAQEAIHASKLRKAKSLLLACAKPVCGKVLYRECTKALTQLESDIPSVVFSAKDDAGAQLVDVDVAMDGEPLTSHLDGHAVSVDPGIHQFFFRGSNGIELVKLPISEGERNRLVSVELKTVPGKAALAKEPVAAAPAAAPPGKAPELAADVTPANAPRLVRAARPMSADLSAEGAPPETGKSATGAYVAGTVGLAGLAGFGILYAIARNDNKDLMSCWPTCSESRLNDVRKLYLAADVSLGVGVAALGVATWLYFDSKSSEERPAVKKPRYAVDVQPSTTGLYATVSGAF